MSQKRPSLLYVPSLLTLMMLVSSVFISVGESASAAASPCKKVGTKRVQEGKTYLCVRDGKKLVWKVMAPAKKSQPVKSGPSPSSTPTPIKSPEPSGTLSPVETPHSQAAKCTNDSLFKRLPLDFSKVSSISPIGVLAPIGGSPLPKYHTGFLLNELGVPLFAPGDLTITEVRKVTYILSPTRPGYIDYALFFSVCDEVTGHFGHVTNLNSNFAPSQSAFECSKYSTVDETVESCTARTSIKVPGGTQLATSGTASHSPAIDIGMEDKRISDGFINPERYGKSGAPGTLCPWDFYSEPLKLQLYSKIGLTSANLTTENPKCGTVAVDKRGSAAGRWTPQNNPGNGMDPADGRFLVFTPDTYMPESRIAFSTRINEIAPSSQYEVVRYPRFPLQISGRVNVSPSGVSVDGQIYCYVVDAASSTESFLVQLVKDGELKVEKITHATGSTICNQSPSQWSFSPSAVTLIR
jgi:hypothetical protein